MGGPPYDAPWRSRRRCGGPITPTPLRCLYNLAILLREKDKLATARRLSERALAIR
jgi:hypothetical protein